MNQDQDQTATLPLLDEAALRRPEFRPGRTLTLADGQEWTLPCPDVSLIPATDPSGAIDIAYQSDFGEEFDRKLDDLDKARSIREEAIVLIKLGVDLLRINYDLAPADFPRLLRCRLDSDGVNPTLTAIYLIATGRDKPSAVAV